MLAKVYPLCVVCMAIILISCSDSSTNAADRKGEVTAKLREDIVLEFSSSTTQLQNNTMGQAISRTMTAEMTISGIERHRLTITIIDDGSSKSSFDVEKGEAVVAYENIGRDEYRFYAETSGIVTLTTLTDKQWVGSFQFGAKNQAGDKEIFCYNGVINVSK